MLSEDQVTEIPGLVKRRLEILPDGVANWHAFYQYQFTAWQEENLDGVTNPLINFCNIIRRVFSSLILDVKLCFSILIRKYRVTIQVGQNLPLTSKQKSWFGLTRARLGHAKAELLF